ncbi:hypothetical protein ES705_49024 [subsurface metagenome]
MGDITRQECFNAWHKYYVKLFASHGAKECQRVALMNAGNLVRKMRILGRQRGRPYHDFDPAKLNRCLSVALSVHKQLSWGLSSSSRGVKLEGRVGGNRL